VETEARMCRKLQMKISAASSEVSFCMQKPIPWQATGNRTLASD